MEPQTQQSQPQPPQTATPATVNSKSALRGPNRCRRRTRANGRCRLPIQDPATGLCFKHARVRSTTHAFDDTCDLSSDLFGPSGSAPSFDSLEQITETLTNLVVLVAQGRLSPRRAAVITYALSFILRSLQAIDKKAAEADADAPTEIIIDVDSAVGERARAQALEQAHEQAQHATPNPTANPTSTPPPPTDSAADERPTSYPSAHTTSQSNSAAPTPPLDPCEALNRYYQLRT